MSKQIVVPVSGGKDSQVVLSLAKLTSDDLICVHQNTGFDHPDTYAQLEKMAAFYNVEIHHTNSKYEGGMFGFLEQAGYFPNSAARGCTQRLKQEPFAAWLIDRGLNFQNCEIWFGMRSDESSARNVKYGGLTPEDEFTLSDIATFYGAKKYSSIGGIRCVLPIVDWTTDQVFDYLRDEGAPINPLYARGHHRVGCYPCMLSRKREWVSAASDPTGRAHLTRLLELEDRWLNERNPRKFIKVHRKWDVRGFLDASTSVDDCDDADGCGYCSI